MFYQLFCGFLTRKRPYRGFSKKKLRFGRHIALRGVYYRWNMDNGPKQYTKNILRILLGLLCTLLLTTCLNPTTVSLFTRAGYVNVRDYSGPCDCEPSHLIRAGNQIIYGLCPNRFYMVEIVAGTGSQGFFFVSPEGILVDDLEDIGRVQIDSTLGLRAIVGLEHGGDVVGLSNDHQRYTYIVHHALPVTGTVDYFDTANPADVNTLVTQGRLHVTPALGQHRLDLYPILDPRSASAYEILTIPIPPLPGNIDPYRRIDGDPRVVAVPDISFVIPVAIDAHEYGFDADYLFVRRDSGNFSFNVLRVIPVYGLSITVNPVRVDEGNLPSITTMGPLSPNSLGTTLLYANFMFYNPGGVFTNIEWRDERGNIIGTTASIQLDFTDPAVRIRYVLQGTHLFSLTATRYGLPWSAIVRLIIGPWE